MGLFGFMKNQDINEGVKVYGATTGAILLDVRTPQEYAEGHIAGALLIPDYEIGDRAQEELPDKEQKILVYCRSGRRSRFPA